MRELTINDFNDILASSAPVPGGGGVSALAGALAAGLNIMVGCLTAGKKKYAPVEDEILSLTAQTRDIQARLLELIDEDAKCFEPLSRAYSMPKDAPGRDATMEQCLVLAASAPMETAKLSCRTIELAKRFAEIGSILAISDAGCAAEIAKAALKCAALNVYVNTRLMKNREKAEEMNAELEEILKRCVPAADSAYNSVLERLHS